MELIYVAMVAALVVFGITVAVNAVLKHRNWWDD